MTAAFGSFDESYPPEILRGYTAPVLAAGAAARRAPAVEVEPVEVDGDELVGDGTGEALPEMDASSYPADAEPLDEPEPEPVAQRATVSRSFVVTPGAPGHYEPDVPPRDRPRNVTELREVASVVDPAPWPAGAYVLVGTTGKRAHWSGEDWHGDESPGYEDDDR